LFIHGWDQQLSQKVIKNSIGKFLTKTFLDRAEIIVVVDNNFKRYLELIGIGGDKVFVMTTMFDSETLDNNSITLSDRPIKLLFLSRFDPLKGGYETLQAVNLLKKNYPNLRLIMAGDGPDFNRLKNYSKKFDLTDNVTFAGYVRGKSKSEVFSNSSIYVFPTAYREGCPVSMIEAMAAGLSIIATPVGAIPSIIKDGKNGILLQNTKPETIANAIEKLITHPEVLKRIQMTNRKIAFEKYEASLVTKKFESLIKSINP
jgi:glycosyltransferase involved in cell wall biosynthesis